MIAAVLLLFSAQAIPVQQLELRNLKAEVTQHQGRTVTHLSGEGSNGLAILKGSKFQNGTIEVELAGSPGPQANTAARGFVGIAFHLQGDRHEVIYLRPTNGRADDMLRRNHSTQYVAEPEWPWERLRKEFPGVYESYVDLEPGVLTRYKIVVNGKRAELYVHGASQPCLIVKDLKMADVTGGVALWVGPGTDAHFASLRITPAP